MKGAEAEMKRKEVKGNARKRRHAKEAKFTSRKLAGIQGKENTRMGRARCPVAGCVASIRPPDVIGPQAKARRAYLQV